MNTPVACHPGVPTFRRLEWVGVGGWGVVENPTELTDQRTGQGTAWNPERRNGVESDVQEALDTDLDAYLDRELFAQPTAEVKPAPGAEKPAERLKSVLALAAEEAQWMGAKPSVEQFAENSKDLDGGTCEIPEHLRVKPAPEVSPAPTQPEAGWAPLPAPLPGLAPVPYLAQPGVPVAPAPAAPSRMPLLVMGTLTGVSAASALVAAMLWITQDSLPDRAQVMAAYAPAGTVATVTTLPTTLAAEPVLFVKDSPLSRQQEPLVADWSSVANGTVEALPGPVVPGRMSVTREVPPPAPVAQAAAIPESKAALDAAAIARSVPVPAQGALATGDKAGSSATKSPEPAVAPVKAEAVKPREKVQARRAPAVEEQQARRELEDPTLADAEEEELPVLQQPQAPQAPVLAKAEPSPAEESQPDEYADLDEDFARKLGFTKDAARKKPEPTGVKSVWVPPDPDSSLPETLTPDDIQQVVIANQPAITSCIRQHQEAIPGMSGGKFVVRWFVLPSGSTQQVAVETKALKGTALATCIEDLVRGWKFPKHRTQMGAIRFPFIF